MGAQHLVVEIVDAEAGLVRHRDETAAGDALVEADGDVVPPLDVDGMLLQRQEVLRGHRDMGRGHGGDRAFRHVDGHGDAVVLGGIADLLRLQDAAAGEQVRVNDGDPAAQERHEALLEVDVLAVQIGTAVLRASWAYWSVYCQGSTSSSQATLYFSMRRASRIPSCSEMWPR